MRAIVKLLTILTSSFLFLTCGTIVEAIKSVINTRIIKIDPKSYLLMYTAVPMICITITMILIYFTDIVASFSP